MVYDFETSPLFIVRKQPTITGTMNKGKRIILSVPAPSSEALKISSL